MAQLLRIYISLNYVNNIIIIRTFNFRCLIQLNHFLQLRRPLGVLGPDAGHGTRAVSTAAAAEAARVVERVCGRAPVGGSPVGGGGAVSAVVLERVRLPRSRGFHPGAVHPTERIRRGNGPGRLLHGHPRGHAGLREVAGRGCRELLAQPRRPEELRGLGTITGGGGGGWAEEEPERALPAGRRSARLRRGGLRRHTEGAEDATGSNKVGDLD